MADQSSRVRVLHVDDDPAFVDTTTAALEEVADGFVVEGVTSASEALSCLEAEPVDCVVSDYEMPGTDGLALLTTVRERYPALPFVLFTGKGSEEIASDAISAGVSDYLEKGGGLEQYELLANRVETVVDQYRAQRAAEQTDRRLRELAEHAADVLWMYSSDWEDLLFLDSDFEGIWGQAIEQRRTDPTAFLDAIHPDDREQARATMDRLSNGEEATAEFRVNEQEGYTRWVRVEGHPIYEDGEVVRIAGYTRDITDRKEREQELERYERIFEGLNDGVYVLNDDERLVHVNDRYTELKGADRETLLGSHVQEWTTDESMSDVRRTRQAVEDGDREVGTVETKFYTADGDWIPAEVRVINIPRPDGGVDRVGVVRDISERKERERELRRQNERLEEFVSVVSHDLRNPLEVAQSRAELLARECTSTHLDHVRDAHDRMAALIEDLLTLTRERDAATDPGPVALDDLVRNCWRTVETDDADLAVETDRTILADRSRLRQLLANLVRNSVEHSSTSSRTESDDSAEHGGTDVTVTVGDLPGGFYVADDGPGIPADERDRVFESGYSTGDDGTGFGLAIVAEIARAHDWTLDVTESEAGGARFEVTGVETPTE